MSFNLSNIKWLWVVIGVVIALVIAQGSSICVVTGYAAVLGFQARGAPDQAVINDFANANAPTISLIFLIVGTFVGGLLAGRRADADALQNGLLVGVLTAVVDLVFSILGGFSLLTLVGVVLAVGGGWLGGMLAVRRGD